MTFLVYACSTCMPAWILYLDGSLVIDILYIKNYNLFAYIHIYL